MKDQYCGLTKEQFERFKKACWSTYQSIGGDMGDGGRSQKDQIEFICDADYIRMYGERGCSRGSKGPANDFPAFYDEVIEPMLRKNFGTKPFMKMMKEVFPHKRYE